MAVIEKRGRYRLKKEDKSATSAWMKKQKSKPSSIEESQMKGDRWEYRKKNKKRKWKPGMAPKCNCPKRFQKTFIHRRKLRLEIVWGWSPALLKVQHIRGLGTDTSSLMCYYWARYYTAFSTVHITSGFQQAFVDFCRNSSSKKLLPAWLWRMYCIPGSGDWNELTPAPLLM